MRDLLNGSTHQRRSGSTAHGTSLSQSAFFGFKLHANTNLTEGDMTQTYQHLRTVPILLPDGTSRKVEDLWYDSATGRIIYIHLDLGGWLSTDEVLISPARLQPSANVSGDWIVQMTEAEVAAAPRWPQDHTMPMADWPTLVSGPFGTTISPPLMGAQISDAAGPDLPDAANTTAPNLAQRHEHLSDLIDQPVFASDGEMGPVSDVALDMKNWVITALLISTDDAADPVQVPLRAVRHRPQPSRHVVVRGVRRDYSELFQRRA